MVVQNQEDSAKLKEDLLERFLERIKSIRTTWEHYLLLFAKEKAVHDKRMVAHQKDASVSPHSYMAGAKIAFHVISSKMIDLELAVEKTTTV